MRKAGFHFLLQNTFGTVIARASIPLLLTALALPAAAATAPSPLDVSQTPAIYAQKGIAPNLFFLLDDSGSMQFELLGSNSADIDSGYPFGNLDYGYPTGKSQVYNANTYCYNGYSGSGCGSSSLQYIPGFDTGNAYAAQFRNSYVNPNYYNPTVVYSPWACAADYPESSDQTAPTSPITNYPDTACHWDDGIGLWVMANADPAEAYVNPGKVNEGYRDLEVWNDSDDVNQSTANNGFAGTANGTLWYLHYNDPGSVCYSHADGYYHCEGTVGFWPATYFDYIGTRPGTTTDYADASNYQRVQICPATATTNSNGVSSADKCTPPGQLPSSPQPYHTYTDASGNYVYIQGDGTRITRTPAEEMQNFSNWFQYYRSHILMSDAGIGIAFMQLPVNFRVDFGIISKVSQNQGFTGQTGIQSTEDFTLSYRSKFLAKLYNQGIPPQGTPNRLALYYVGEWYAGSLNSSAPWGSSNAEKQATGENDLVCRPNYTLLMTDGQWSGSSPNVGNQDNETGSVITDSIGDSFQYQPVYPYKDDIGNTLADVAMQFWKTDLQSGMANTVPVNSQDAAFWQHMTTFTVGLGVVPSLVKDYITGTGQFSTPHPNLSNAQAQQAVYQDLVSGTVSWPDPGNSSADSPTKIDDTWHAAVDGHGVFTSAQNPTELYKAIRDELVNIVNRTAAASSLAVNTEKAGQTRTQLQVFQALFHPQNWWGDVLALPVLATPATTTSPSSLSISSDATWSASCVLTGGGCPQMGTSPSGQPLHTVSVEAPSNRTVLSWTGTSAVAFTANTLSPAALTTIGGPDVVNYLRGDRSKEAGSGGSLRLRNSVMGDVVNSSPTFVGAPNANYADSWSNVLYPSQTGLNPENNSSALKYSKFVSNNVDRENLVYVGGDDGMLHAFRAGTTTDISTNDGKEVLAYVPHAVYPNLKQYSSTAYQHHYYVNATPAAGDVFYNNQWQTWLVGGEGAGGNSIFALNITDPSQFSQSHLTTVIGEWEPGNICNNKVSTCNGSDLGDSFGTPVITRFNNGQWGFVLGNGLNSATGTASIFVGLIQSDGSVKFQEITTGYGPGNDPSGANRPDGIAYVTPVDLNGDHTADYVYAGDYFGNVWRFNLTSNSVGDWSADYGGSATPTPMFTASNSNGTAQPITTKPVVAAVPALNGYSRIMVEFGTGAAVTTAQQAPDTTSAGVQSVYGVWDWDFSAWNAGEPTSGVTASTPVAYQYDALSTNPGTLTRSDLTSQSIIAEQTSNTVQGGTNNNRVVTANAVCWEGDPATTSCTLSQNTHYGWYMDLVSPNLGRQGEKVVYNPVMRAGVLILTTNIPSSSSGLTCEAQGIGGWTMALDPATGGRLQFEVFDTKGNGNFDQITLSDGTKVNTSGISLGAVGTPSFVTYDNTTYIVTNTSGGKPTLSRTHLSTGRLGVQLSWQELR